MSSTRPGPALADRFDPTPNGASPDGTGSPAQDVADDQEGRAAAGADPEQDEKVAGQELEQTFVRSIDAGRRRLSRRPWPLIATGVLGGIDVGTGVLALLVVEDATGAHPSAGVPVGDGRRAGDTRA